MSYSDAGVDRDAAAGAKRRIRDIVRSTFNEDVLSDIGSFGGGFRISVGDGSATLVASADGVGTKLKVAVMAGRHEAVGYDIVAHCADDILTQGALPLFFLDYLALGKMDEELVESVLRGVASACRDVGAALIGGETAEMPDIYQEGEYDLAGFIVGRSDGSLLDGSAIRPGDRTPRPGLERVAYQRLLAGSENRLRAPRHERRRPRRGVGPHGGGRAVAPPQRVRCCAARADWARRDQRTGAHHRRRPV